MPSPRNPPRKRLRTRVQRERENAEELGDVYKFTRDPELAQRRAEERRNRAASAMRVRATQCALRGCRREVYDHETLSVCHEHAVEIWEIVERRDDYPHIFESLQREADRRDAIRAEHREAAKVEDRELLNAPDAIGDIYFVKVGDLVKVGWTSDLPKRMRAYGPHAQLLAHYEATRTDETNLHRNLRPSRAKGREWYQDDAIIRAFVSRAIREHGEPTFTTVLWTEPKRVVAGKRATRR